MNTFRKALTDRHLTLKDVANKGISFWTARSHYYGARSVGMSAAIMYERILGISRSELRPDLWPPEKPKCVQ